MAVVVSVKEVRRKGEERGGGGDRVKKFLPTQRNDSSVNIQRIKGLELVERLTLDTSWTALDSEYDSQD